MSNRSFLSSILSFRCPACREGHLFYRPWTMSTAYTMPERCEVCNQNYMPEPGFYYGSMFLSYIMTAFLFLGLALVGVFALKWSLGITFAGLIVLALVSHNFFFRFARVLWIHLVVKKREDFPHKES